MNATLLQINTSLGGLPKYPVPQALITPLGLEGDRCAHPQIHGGPEKAVLLIASETIDELVARGYPLVSGSLGENLTTLGLDPRWLRLGQRLRVGQAELELTSIRRPCSALDVYGPQLKNELYDAQVRAGDPASPRWGLSGFYARVLRAGVVRTNDVICVVATLA